MFGLNTCVGISNFSLGPSLIQSLHTEAELCVLFGIKDGVPIEETIVESYVATRSRTKKIITGVGGAGNEAPHLNFNLPTLHPISPLDVAAPVVLRYGLPTSHLPVEAADLEMPLIDVATLASHVRHSLFDD